ncbi:MAG: hypothetical protein RML12_03420 [Xanthomonadales bacterium]|nr:hypothetical protein [Xanthomonadales bacterium]
MRPLRLLRLWVAIERLLWIALALVLVGPAMPVPLARAAGDKLVHALGFATLAAWAALLRERRRALLQALIALAIFGAALEGVQVRAALAFRRDPGSAREPAGNRRRRQSSPSPPSPKPCSGSNDGWLPRCPALRDQRATRPTGRAVDTPP